MGPASRRARAALVVAEVALSLVLLVGAGLLVRSFVSLLRVDRGYRTDHVLAVTVQAWGKYGSGAQRARFARHVVERLAALPGVRAAGMTSSLPLAEAIGADRATFRVGGGDASRDEEAPDAHVTVATEGYFDVLGIALRRGRLLTSADDADARPVVLVTEALARRHFPGEDPVGRDLVLGFMGPPIAREIVGVVADLRQTGLAADPGPAVFIPHAQAPTGAMTFTLRTAGDPALLLGPVKAELTAIDRAVPVSSATTLDAVLGGVVRERRFHLALLGAFAATALLLAGVGLYGVLSHAVRERSREIGVRLALGADAPAVLRLILGEGVRLVIAGTALGVLAAAGGTRVLRDMLFRVEPLDGVTFASVTVLVLAVAAVASLIPAWRAARVDPLLALRDE